MNELLRCAPSNKPHDVYMLLLLYLWAPRRTGTDWPPSFYCNCDHLCCHPSIEHTIPLQCTKRLHTTNRQCCQLTTPVKGDFTKTCDQSRYPRRVSPCCPSDSQKRYNKCTNHKSRTFPSAWPYLNEARDEAWLLLQSINTQNKTLTYQRPYHTPYNQSSS